MSAPISVGAYCAAAAWSLACSGTTVSSLAGAGDGVGDEHPAIARTTSATTDITRIMVKAFRNESGRQAAGAHSSLVHS
jgi:hypothetical protein